MRRIGKMSLGLSASIAALIALSSATQAQCTFTGIQSISGGSGYLGAYTAVRQPQPHLMTMSLTLTVVGTGDCTGAIAFQSPTVPAQMKNGAATLLYDIRAMSGASLLYTTQPTASVPISARVVAGQTTATVPVQVQALVLQGQSAPTGSYNASTVALQLVTPTAQVAIARTTSAIRTGSLNSAAPLLRR